MLVLSSAAFFCFLGSYHADDIFLSCNDSENCDILLTAIVRTGTKTYFPSKVRTWCLDYESLRVTQLGTSTSDRLDPTTSCEASPRAMARCKTVVGVIFKSVCTCAPPILSRFGGESWGGEYSLL